MTHENRQANIAADLERGGEALRAAQLLVEHHMLPDSVSRAYYGMLHHARALLLTEGHEPKTHGGVTHLLNLHFVRAGIFSPEHARAFARRITLTCGVLPPATAKPHSLPPRSHVGL